MQHQHRHTASHAVAAGPADRTPGTRAASNSHISAGCIQVFCLHCHSKVSCGGTPSSILQCLHMGLLPAAGGRAGCVDIVMLVQWGLSTICTRALRMPAAGSYLQCKPLSLAPSMAQHLPAMCIQISQKRLWLTSKEELRGGTAADISTARRRRLPRALHRRLARALRSCLARTIGQRLQQNTKKLGAAQQEHTGNFQQHVGRFEGDSFGSVDGTVSKRTNWRVFGTSALAMLLPGQKTEARRHLRAQPLAAATSWPTRAFEEFRAGVIL